MRLASTARSCARPLPLVVHAFTVMCVMRLSHLPARLSTAHWSTQRAGITTGEDKPDGNALVATWAPVEGRDRTAWTRWRRLSLSWGTGAVIECTPRVRDCVSAMPQWATAPHDHVTTMAQPRATHTRRRRPRRHLERGDSPQSVHRRVCGWRCASMAKLTRAAVRTPCVRCVAARRA